MFWQIIYYKIFAKWHLLARPTDNALKSSDQLAVSGGRFRSCFWDRAPVYHHDTQKANAGHDHRINTGHDHRPPRRRLATDQSKGHQLCADKKSSEPPSIPPWTNARVCSQRGQLLVQLLSYKNCWDLKLIYSDCPLEKRFIVYTSSLDHGRTSNSYPQHIANISRGDYIIIILSFGNYGQ